MRLSVPLCRLGLRLPVHRCSSACFCQTCWNSVQTLLLQCHIRVSCVCTPHSEGRLYECFFPLCLCGPGALPPSSWLLCSFWPSLWCGLRFGSSCVSHRRTIRCPQFSSWSGSPRPSDFSPPAPAGPRCQSEPSRARHHLHSIRQRTQTTSASEQLTDMTRPWLDWFSGM